MPREIYSRNWDRMSFDEQREYRDRKLAHFVRTQLYPYSPFYQKLFDDNGIKPGDIRRAEDLRKLPFTFKADIAPDTEDPERFRMFILGPDEELIRKYMPRLQRARLSADRLFKGEEYLDEFIWKNYSPVHVQFTTGRTGLPTPILFAARDVIRMAEAGRRVLDLAGFGREYRYEKAVLVNAMPYAPHLGFWMVAKGLDSAGVLTLHTGGGRILGTERTISAVEGMKAMGIVGMPGYTYRLLRTAAERGCDFSSVKLVLVSGERVPPGMKEKMSGFLESMGAEKFHVLGAFGFTEARKAYSECTGDEETGYHLYPDLDYVEIVDPDNGEPVGEGEDGELAYTCLEGQGTCVMRFRSGDFVRGGIVYEPCPSCGRKVPRLASDITRSAGVKGFSLAKIKGVLVDQGVFAEVLGETEDVAEWMVEIKKEGDDPYEVDVVELFIAPVGGADTAKIERHIVQKLGKYAEITPNEVNFLPLGELVERLKTESSLKELHVVDRRPEI